MIKFIKWSIFVTILCTPIFGMMEYFFLLGQFVPTAAKPLLLTSPILKSVKDIMLILIVINYMFLGCLRPRYLRLPWLGLFAFLFMEFILSLLQNGLPLTLLSSRIFLPFLLIPIAYHLFSHKDMERLKTVVIITAITESLLGVLQLFIGIKYYTFSLAGLTFSRATGTFFTPNSLAIFLLAAIAFLLASKLKTSFDKSLFLVFSVLLVFTASVIGILGYLVELAVYYLTILKSNRYLKGALLMLAIIIAVAIIYSLPIITGRGEGTSQSFQDRVQIFANYIGNNNAYNILLGNGFGAGSNTLQLLKSSDNNMLSSNNSNETNNLVFISDSLYTSLISQVGIIGLFILLSFISLQIIKSFTYKIYLSMLFVPMFLVAGLGSIVIEFFPINWLFAIIIGYTLAALKGHNNEDPD